MKQLFAFLCVAVIFQICLIQCEYRWTKWTHGDTCERLCTEAFGRINRTRGCIYCFSNKTCHIQPTVEECETKLNSFSLETIPCYDAIHCHGKGPHTGIWGDWLELGECETAFYIPPCSDTMPRTVTSGLKKMVRDCLPTNKSIALGSVHLKEYGTPYILKCSGDQKIESDTKYVRCNATCKHVEETNLHGYWGQWGPWNCGFCTSSKSITKRRRECIDSFVLHPCKSDQRNVTDLESSLCGKVCGKIWSDWSEWSECTQTCGESSRTRYRECRGYGEYCHCTEIDKNLCAMQFSPCPFDKQNDDCPSIDGKWGDWSRWNHCSVTCDGNGIRDRARKCDNPAPLGRYGKLCEGNYREVENCHMSIKCPIHGKWGEWSMWFCPVTCGGGTEYRRRFCNRPPPSLGGDYCYGKPKETQICANRTCQSNFQQEFSELMKLMAQNLNTKNYNYIKKSGDGLVLECNPGIILKFRTLFKYAMLFWLYQGKLMMIDVARMTLDAESLIFSYLSHEDTGTYYCLMQAGNDRYVVDMFTVAVVPEEPIDKVRIGDSLSMPCNEQYIRVYLSSDQVRTTWYFNYPKIVATDASVLHTTVAYNGMYICILEEFNTSRAWITNLERIDLELDFFFLRHPYLTTLVALAVLSLILSGTMYCVFLMEIKERNLNRYADAYIYHLQNPAMYIKEEIEPGSEPLSEEELEEETRTLLKREKKKEVPH